MAEPPPGDVDREPSHPTVAGSADAEFAFGAATLIGRRGEPCEGTHFLAVLELPPGEELQAVGPGRAESDALQRVEPSHLVKARVGQILSAMASLLIDLAHLGMGELPPLELPQDALPGARGKRRSIPQSGLGQPCGQPFVDAIGRSVVALALLAYATTVPALRRASVKYFIGARRSLRNPPSGTEHFSRQEDHT